MQKVKNEIIKHAQNTWHFCKLCYGLAKTAPEIARYFFRDFVAFNILIIFYVIDTVLVKKLTKILPYAITSTIIAQFYRTYALIEKKLDYSSEGTIPKIDLIKLSIRNMQVKKTRTLITIGGVSIGIGAIVFLVSLGYGLQRLVISKVARLDELKQADVITQPGSKVKIDDKTLADVKQFPNVFDVYPLISVVGRVNFQNSITDMAVYGVTTGYLEKSAIKPIKGDIFQSNETAIISNDTKASGEVSGAKDIRYSKGQKIGTADFAIDSNNWIRVRSGPGPENEILGYTKGDNSIKEGSIFVGTSYEDDKYGAIYPSDNNETLGMWLHSDFLLWEENEDGGYAPMIDEANQVQLHKEGYTSTIGISNISPNVLAEATENTEAITTPATATDPLASIEIDPNSDWVALPDEEQAATEEVSKVQLSDKAVKKAVVNRAMLKILGLNENDAVGKKFSASFVLPSYLLQETSKRVESVPADYEIVGVTPDEASPIFYVPFIDLRSLGITNFSQFKVMSQSPEHLDKIRKQIEGIGYSTTSVVDTVAQINSLFATIRMVLGIMGMIALAVASLGMFNTLTVSLLERSREVGLMKAMGMKTSEVQELFLTESMIMGFCSGIAGLAIGFIGGKLVGLLLSSFALFKGQGYLDVTQIPISFVTVIMILSLFVGLFTGIYPAKRSKKISALDALRYE